MPFSPSIMLLAVAAQCVPLEQAPKPPPAVSAAVPNSTYYSDDSPPARFQGGRKTVIEFLSPDEVNTVCAAYLPPLPCGFKWQACAVGSKLYMPNSCQFSSSDSYAHLLCHEVAHLNGWPESHGN